MRTTYFVLPFLLDIVANLKNGNISIAILSIWFLWHLQEDPLVGQWRRVGYYVHECATDKLIRTETEQMALEEEFRSDGTWEVVGSPWKGTWHRLNNNAYRFVYAPHAQVDPCRVEFHGDELRLYARTCDSLQTNDKKLYGYLLLRKMNKTHYQ